MLYRKNIYRWEQWSRIVAGLVLAGLGLALTSGIVAYLIAAGGLALAITGVFGWCPACAMVGRRLRDGQ